MRHYPSIELSEVTKKYGPTLALDGVSFTVSRGEIVVLLGSNGAGKTTTTLLLAGLLRPTCGQVRVCGGDPCIPATRRRLGVLPQMSLFPPTITVRELIALARAHFPDPVRTATLLSEFGLEDVAERRMGTLSQGYWRRTALCASFAGRPDAVILDEPTAGLDVDARGRLSRWLAEFAANGGAVLLTTHHLSEAQALASRAIMLRQGRVVFEGGAAELRKAGGPSRISFKRQHLPALPEGVRAETRNGSHLLYAEEAGRLVEYLVHHGVSLDQLEVVPPTLEDAFMHLAEQ